MDNTKILNKKFYDRPTLNVAQELLGKKMIRKYRGKELVGRIVETEAYIGYRDKACHAAKGKTKRNEVMFGKAGHAYIYMIYGMYHCLNIVTEKEDYPAAVLIRAIEPLAGIDEMVKYRKLKDHKKINIASGPGKLCQAMQINKSLNGASLTGDKLWIIDNREDINDEKIVKTKRVGIEYAEESQDLLWRFYIKNNKYISQK